MPGGAPRTDPGEGSDATVDVGPAAEGAKLPFASLPTDVVTAIETALGSAVALASDQPGGFTPGVAARLELASGRRAFAKAVSPDPNPWSPEYLRREARVTAALPDAAPSPGVLATLEIADWVVLLLEDVDGRQPELPWDEAVLRQVLSALDDLVRTCTPCPIELPPVAEVFDDEPGLWGRLRRDGSLLAEVAPWLGGELAGWIDTQVADLERLVAPWREALAGDSLVHGDVRADNLLVTADGVVLVDWPWASTGAAVTDVVLLLPSVAMQSTVDPEAALVWSDTGRAAPADQVDTLLALVAAYFVHHGVRPPPPGLPTVRAFQQGQARTALAWLRRRLEQR